MATKMRKPRIRDAAVSFFWSNAGYSHGPNQSPEDGRMESAKGLAEAERAASDAGCSFEWEQDDETDASFRKTRNPYRLWVCIMRDQDGKVVQSLCGVDFGADRDPWMDPYRRVVEAELASEWNREASRV